MRFVLALLLASSTVAANPKIDAVMKEWSGKDRPGCSVAVVQAGKTTFAKGYGMADLERGVPNTPETVFDIGSVSKQFTAATILLLEAERKLGLDDDIRKHVPELPALAKKPITVRQLVHHTGGLRDYTTLLMLTGKQIADVATVKETLAILTRQRGLEHEPGSKHAYSNTGYFVLAQIAERAGKQSMAELARDRIFKPLGMTKTLILDAHATIIPGRAIGYSKKATGWQLEMSQWEQTGDGAVQTTVNDLARWDANFYDPKVGGKALIDRMLVKGKLADGTELAYAAGLLHGTYRDLPIVQHGGAWAGYRAELVRFPAQRTSVIVLCNAASSNPTRLAYGIADVVLDKQLGKVVPKPVPPKRAKVDGAILDAWVGTYRGTIGLFVIKRNGDDLVVVVNDNEIAIDPASKQQATVRDDDPNAPNPIKLELSGTPPKRKLKISGPLVDTADELVPYKATAAEVASFAGRYYSPELRVVWTLAAAGTSLTASGVGFDDPVEIVGRDELVVTGVAFKRVKGNLLVTAGSIRDVVFERLR